MNSNDGRNQNSGSEYPDNQGRRYEQLSPMASSPPARATRLDDQQMLIEEEHLSQKMKNLTTSSTVDKKSPVKQILTSMSKIPVYLTKRNESFQRIIHEALNAMTVVVTNDNREKLRKAAICIYKIMFISTYQALWTTYQKSVTGHLIDTTNLPIWPKEINHLLILAKLSDTNEKEVGRRFVEDTLNELEIQMKQYHTELNTRSNYFTNYTLTIQRMIEIYIEQNLHSHRISIEHQIQLVNHDYHIQALQLEYERHHPNATQKQLMKNLCQCKYQQETSEQEYNLLRQQIAYHNLPGQSFDCSSISHCATIDSIQNPEIRHQLLQHYKHIAEQSRLKMFQLYLKTVEVERNGCKKKYDTVEKKMWMDRRMTLDDEKIPPIMINLIEQRCSKMSDRIKCIYQYKAQSIGIESHSLTK